MEKAREGRVQRTPDGREAPRSQGGRDPLEALITRWERRAHALPRVAGDRRGGWIWRRAAAELRRALESRANEVLSLEAAARESGYCVDHLRRLVGAGIIPNAGRRGAPRIRRRDVPLKAGATARMRMSQSGLIARGGDYSLHSDKTQIARSVVSPEVEVHDG